MPASQGTRARITFELRTACTVYSYPSHGGITMKRFTNPELEHLGLSHKMSDSGPLSDQEQEDAFALRMLHLGARWWPSLKFYDRHTRDEPYPYGHHFPSDLHVAYTPTGSGIWVLVIWAENSQTWLEEYDPPRKPEDWVDLAYCRTMEE
ncbi:hypothetical protein J4E90_010687 [Alternaria incomplexa]|uniref:uncharacterized protein n=1 Tax=Alternaria incomplexa TaxID=1187928 RepID=UPI002220752D|nr:uncharacterized protein J4E90_010687 [Alternaria incomplexa]KAI4906342.1 hypothetical protein J4E90_010687 [Alternaria incomplexa]